MYNFILYIYGEEHYTTIFQAASDYMKDNIYVNFRERYEDMIENRIDFVSYICNISSCESLKKNYS